VSFESRIDALRREIVEIDPGEARALSAHGAVLVDVREENEIARGLAEGALPLGRGFLEQRIGPAVPKRDTPVLLMCGSGTRSLLAADALRRLDFTDVRSVAGGFERWKEQGLPYAIPEAVDAGARERYARQLSLPELGAAGQKRLDNARVLIVGAGGLGAPAALYLAAAGVGTLGLVDDDRVERSNLHRQVIHRDDRVGQFKVESARATLAALNPDITLRTHNLRLTRDNVESVLGEYDLVLDGSDNFPTRYLRNDACMKLGLTNVYGAVQGFEGQVSVFKPAAGPCYRCLFAEPPPAGAAPSCSEAGVLGVAPGIIGLLQALEAMKLIVGFGEPLIGRLLLFNAKVPRLRELKLARDPECRYCAPDAVFPGYLDYQAFCGGDSCSGAAHAETADV